MGIEIHFAIAGMLPEKPQVLLGACPAQKAKWKLLHRSED